MNVKTKKFLQDIDILFPNHAFYKMKIDKIVKGKKKYKGGATYVSSKKEVLAENEKGFCVFFTPNWDYNLSWWERKIKNAKNVYAFFAEMDIIENVDAEAQELSDEYWQTLLLEPSIVIRTKRWYHMYWLFKRATKYTDQKAKDLKEWVKSVWWDEGAADMARMMRLPWSQYYGDNIGSFTVEVVSYKPDLKYSYEDIKNVLNKWRFLQQKRANENKKLWWARDSVVDMIESSVDVRSVLEWLGMRKVKGTHIYEWGKRTSWYKYWAERNAVVNFTTGKSRPQWWPYFVAKELLWWSIRDTRKYFKEYHNIDIPVSSSPSPSEQVTHIANDEGDIELAEYAVDDRHTVVVSLGSDDLKSGTYIRKITDKWEDTIQVLSWGLMPVAKYTENNMAKYVCYWKKGDEDWYVVLEQLWISGRFDKALGNIGITNYFKAWDFLVKCIIEFVHACDNEIDMYNMLWIYDNIEIFDIWQELQEHDGKQFFLNTESIWERQGVTTIARDTSKAKIISINEWAKIINESYKESIATTVYMWYAMAMFSYHVRKMFGFFPIMQLVGLTQSGKTTLRTTIRKMFGISSLLEVQSATSEFVLMKLAQHFMPLVLTEFENADARINWSIALKNNYDWSKNSRGTKDQNVIMYENNAAMLLDGESRSLNNAVFSRTIACFMNPSMKKMQILEDYNVLPSFLEKRKDVYKLPHIFKDQVKELKASYKNSIHQEKDRIIENYALLMAFSRTFWLDEEHIEVIAEQCANQFLFLWENNIDKLIKTVFSHATIYKMNAVLEGGDDPVIRVQFFVDAMRISQAKHDDIKSQIQLVNAHFFPDKSSVTDELFVPLKYMMSNKNTHVILNNMLNHIARLHDLGMSPRALKTIIKTYAEANRYDTEGFYYSF